MKLALLEAQKAYKIDEIPVGAVVIFGRKKSLARDTISASN